MEEILMIDGNLRTQHRLAETVLKPGNFGHLEALNGKDALRLVRDRDPALIILSSRSSIGSNRGSTSELVARAWG